MPSHVISTKHRVVCTFFNLPPEEQTLCKLTDIAAMFPPPLDFLNLAMAAAEARAYRAPSWGLGLKSEIDDLRKKTVQICQNFISVITLTQNFATASLKLVELSAAGSAREEVLKQLSTVVSQAGTGAKQIEKVQRETRSFSNAVSLTERSLEVKWSRHGSSITEITSGGISEIFSDWGVVLDTCDKMLQECAEYYRKTKEHYFHSGTLEYDPPSKEEIVFIRERWLGLSKGLLSMNKSLRRTHRRLERAPDARKYDNIPQSWKDSPEALDSESESEDEAPTTLRWGRKKAGSLKSTSTSSSTKHVKSASRLFSSWKSKLFRGTSEA